VWVGDWELRRRAKRGGGGQRSGEADQDGGGAERDGMSGAAVGRSRMNREGIYEW
jgi:hypothetical protein